MPIEEATVKAQQSEVAVGTTSAEEGVKKAKGRKRSRRLPVGSSEQADRMWTGFLPARWKPALQIGVGMVPRGEVGLIVAAV
jgi:hypothetical protein